MKKALIVSFWDCNNFGNRLQSYALNKLLSDFFDVKPVNLIYRLNNSKKFKIKLILKSFLSIIGISRFRDRKQRFLKWQKLESWSNNYMPFQIDIGNQYKDIKKVNLSSYTFVISGSDQVWHNFHRQENELEYYYLFFAPKEKRASFAPSFGLEVLPPEDIEIHRIGLTGMRFLSCREKSGCNIIYDLIGREAVLLPDPTLCLSKAEWKLREEPVTISFRKKFILKYILGKNDAEVDCRINELCEKNGFAIIDLSDKDSDYIAINPGQFLYLIDNAEYVFTDSFHATAFSIIFNTNFYVLPRKGSFNQMFNRIETLLNRFNLQRRVVKNSMFDLISLSNSEKDNIEYELLQCKKEALDYIGNIISELG